MLKSHLGNKPEIKTASTEMVSEKQLIQSEEIADTIYFCANHSVISGAMLHANLGKIQR